MRRRGFNLNVEGGVYLSIEDIWPDGDAPKNPTREEVAKRLRESGSLRQIILEWNLPVSIDVDGLEAVWTP